MNDMELRVAALENAVRYGAANLNTDGIVEAAQKFYNFLLQSPGGGGIGCKPTNEMRIKGDIKSDLPSWTNN